LKNVLVGLAVVLVAVGLGDMALAEGTPPVSPKNVAILLFPGVQIIDYAAPYEVFGQAHTHVFTVAEKAGPITTAMGSVVIPAYTLENSPRVDVLVVPGGDAVFVEVENAKLIRWIRSTAANSQFVLSVCSGAFLLAKAGLLDGLEATTFHLAIDALASAAPKTRVVRGQRYVDNGKVITSGGLTAGIDGSLHVVERLFGAAKARAVAKQLEYESTGFEWNPRAE